MSSLYVSKKKSTHPREMNERYFAAKFYWISVIFELITLVKNIYA